MNISIEIKAPDLANAILALAHAIDRRSANIAKVTEVLENKKAENQTQTIETQNVQAVSTAIPTAAPTAPVQHPAQKPTQQEQSQTVPTSAPTYTMDQLAVAATQLVDAGRREELVQLLASFGVQALTALPKEQYGAFATKLREMGAKI